MCKCARQSRRVRFAQPHRSECIRVRGNMNHCKHMDASDTTAIQGVIDVTGYDVRGDLNLSGNVNTTDKTIAAANTNTGGWGVLSGSDYANRKGYAGYEFDDIVAGAQSMWHVRHRVLNSDLGRWMQRLAKRGEYSQNGYTFASSQPVQVTDASARKSSAGGGSAGELDRPCELFDPHCRYTEELDPRSRPCSELDPHQGRCAAFVDPNTQSEHDACCQWADLQALNGCDWLRALPNCPCMLFLGINGGVPLLPIGWEGLEYNPSYHPGARWCIRSTPMPDESGQQCCYDALGDLITRGPGAGTPDLYSPGANPPLHWDEDVTPFNECEAANLLEVYWLYRPPNNGNNCPDNPPYP